MIAHETGVANTIDPLAGSYFVETLTDQMEEAAYDYFRRIDEMGGMVEAVKQNFPQREIADASFRYQQEVDSGKRIIVGVNDFTEGNDENIPILQDRPGARAEAGRPARRPCAPGATPRPSSSRSRSCARWPPAGGNLMYPLLECARVHASEGEIIESMQRVFGTYTETPVF